MTNCVLVDTPGSKLEPSSKGHFFGTALLHPIFWLCSGYGRNLLHVLFELETLPSVARCGSRRARRLPFRKQRSQRSTEPKTVWREMSQSRKFGELGEIGILN